MTKQTRVCYLPDAAIAAADAAAARSVIYEGQRRLKALILSIKQRLSGA
jgi:hypothetical protein